MRLPGVSDKPRFGVIIQKREDLIRVSSCDAPHASSAASCNARASRSATPSTGAFGLEVLAIQPLRLALLAGGIGILAVMLISVRERRPAIRLATYDRRQATAAKAMGIALYDLEAGGK
jgi:hypothetical protein